MKAATDLLLDGGPDALTVDGVVARSGVAKSTVYRHWATRDDLVTDVLASCAPSFDAPDPGATFAEALEALVGSLVAVMDDEHWKRFLPALLLLKTQQGAIADLDGRMKQQQMDVIAEVLRRGVDEGVLRPDVLDDVDATITLLTGPILMAGLLGSTELDGAFADQVTAQFLAGHRVGAPLPTG